MSAPLLSHAMRSAVGGPSRAHAKLAREAALSPAPRVSKKARVVAAIVAALCLAAWLVSRSGGPPPTGGGAPSAASSSDVGRSNGASVDPRFGEKGSITGWVTDGGSKPIGGAQVCAEASSALLSSREMREPICVISADDGRYVLPALVPASYSINASAPGFRPGTHQNEAGLEDDVDVAAGEERTRVDVVLGLFGVEFSGRVHDPTGAPIPGALVRVSSHGATATVRANGDGSFVASVSEGDVSVESSADGYADESSHAIAPSASNDVELYPESILAGRVVDAESGAPIEGALVSSGADGTSRTETYLSGRTDADGRFVIDRLGAGRYKPSAESLGLYGVSAQSVVVGLGERADELVIRVHHAYVLTARIEAEDTHAPCARGTASLHSPTDERYLDAQTDRDGQVLFRSLQAGTYRVELNCDGLVPKATYDSITVPSDVSSVVWKMRAGRAVRGVVVDEAGAPVAGVLVRASGGEEIYQEGEARSRADGTFAIAGMIPGEVTVDLNDARLAKAQLVQLPEDHDLEGVRLVVERGGAIEGQVVDAAGKGLPGITVNEGARDEGGQHHTVTSAAGTYRIDGLEAGAHEIMLIGDDGVLTPLGSEGNTTVVELHAREVAHVRSVVTRDDAMISGRVVDREGKPLAGIFVEASCSRRKGDGGRARPKPRVTDADGHFVLEHLAACRHEVRAGRAGGQDVTVEADAGSTITLTMPSLGSISGTISASEGAVGTFLVVATDREHGTERRESFFRTGGAFALRDVPAGSYTVVATVAAVGHATDHVTIAEGANASVAMVIPKPASVRGVVVLFGTDTPVAGMRVSVTSLGPDSDLVSDEETGDEDDPTLSQVTGPDGRFELTHVSPGKIALVAYPESDDSFGDAMEVMVLEPGASAEAPPLRSARARTKPGEASGTLGLRVDHDGEYEPATCKLKVEWVAPGGPAALAGIKVGDVVVAVDGNDVTGANAYLYDALTQVTPGAAVSLQLEGGATVSLVTAARPKELEQDGNDG